jgi:hypothetical protein
MLLDFYVYHVDIHRYLTFYSARCDQQYKDKKWTLFRDKFLIVKSLLHVSVAFGH